MQDVPDCLHHIPICFFFNCLFPAYQVLVPWHPGEQELAVALKFKEATVFVTPFMCVAAVTTVALYPAPWQVEHANPCEFTWNEC